MLYSGRCLVNPAVVARTCDDPEISLHFHTYENSNIQKCT